MNKLILITLGVFSLMSVTSAQKDIDLDISDAFLDFHLDIDDLVKKPVIPLCREPG